MGTIQLLRNRDIQTTARDKIMLFMYVMSPYREQERMSVW